MSGKVHEYFDSMGKDPPSYVLRDLYGAFEGRDQELFEAPKRMKGHDVIPILILDMYKSRLEFQSMSKRTKPLKVYKFIKFLQHKTEKVPIGTYNAIKRKRKRKTTIKKKTTKKKKTTLKKKCKRRTSIKKKARRAKY